MKEEIKIENGFNHGYSLMKLKPELAESLGDGFSSKSDPYALGFLKGIEELEKEKSKLKTHKNYQVGLKSKNNISRSKDKDRDINLNDH